MRSTIWRVLVGLLALALYAGLGARTSPAQTGNAGVVGTINDASGAAVPGAGIKVTNVATGQSFSAKTGNDGTYTLPAILNPGNYQVEASKSGFKTTTSDAFTLQIGDVKQINLTLQVGTETEKVTVTAAPVANLQTETSDRGAVITGRQIVDLPLNGQDFTQLAVLQPGVTTAYVGVLTDVTAFNQGNPSAGSVPGGSNAQGSTEAARFSRAGGASISVNGQRPTNNDFTIDGVDNNEPQFGTIGVFPNPEAIQEFKIDTSLAKAEYGRGGAVVNTLYKSGTNDFHGEIYYFGQNDALNASHWVLNENGLKKAATHINEFGGTIGGPVLLPHYNGKDKTFFFFDYLGQRDVFGNGFTSDVPTALARQGNFSEFLPTQIIDPLTCPANPLVPGNHIISTPGPGTTCQFFAGNIIANLQGRSDFSPQGFALLNAYPMPNLPIAAGGPTQGSPDFAGVRRNQENINSYDAKIDQKISEKNHIAGRFTYDNQNQLRGNYFPGLPTAGFGAGSEIGNTRQVVVDDTHVFTPTILNEAKFGWTRVDIGILNCGVEGACGSPPDFCTKLGIPNCNKGTPATTGGILEGVFGTGFLEFLGDGGLFDVRSNNFYASDNVSIIHGKHTLKFGGEARPTLLAPIDGGRAGGLKGQLQYGSAAFPDIGNGQADILLGQPAIFASSGTIEGGDIPLHLHTTEWGFFVQDDWKTSPNLTLNLGLRYELFPPFKERDARLANFDPTTGAIDIAKGSSDGLVSTPTGNIGPRIGFAYNFGSSKQFVLRGGYGVFYAQDGVDFPPLGRNPPIISSVGFGFSSTSTQAFNFTTGPPLAPIVNPPVITPASTLFSVPPNPLNDSIQEWNLGVQYQFGGSYLLDVGYAGSRGHHLLATRDLGSDFNGLGFALAPTASCGTPPCHIGSDTLYDNRANSAYDGLQTSLQRRFAHGVEFQMSYTWSHGIDDSTGVFNGIGESRGQSGGPIDPFNFNLDRGNSSLDHRHVFVANGIWDLPFGRGKAFGGDTSGAVDKVIGGWELNFIQTLQSGQHFDVVINTPIGALRPDIIGNARAGTSINNYLNIAAFASPAASVTNLAGSTIPVGDLSRNFFTGPGLYTTNLSLFKNTAVTERVKTQFQLSFFNAWNSVNRIVPDNNVSDGAGAFGTFRGSGANAFPPRTIQYALKILF